MKFLVENNRKTYIFDRTKSWLAYKEKTKNRPKKHKVKDEETYRKIIHHSLEVIKEMWTNSTGGVYVKNLGYFGVYRTPKKTMSHRNKFSFIDRLETDGYMYILSHFTNLKNTDDIYGFNLNDTFSRRMTQDLYKNLREGRRYTLNYFLIKNYLKNRTHL